MASQPLALNFPIVVEGYKGTRFEISREKLAEDYAYNVRHWDDLSPEEQDAAILNLNDDILSNFFRNHWTWQTVVDNGTRLTRWGGNNRVVFLRKQTMTAKASDSVVFPSSIYEDLQQ